MLSPVTLPGKLHKQSDELAFVDLTLGMGTRIFGVIIKPADEEGWDDRVVEIFEPTDLIAPQLYIEEDDDDGSLVGPRS